LVASGEDQFHSKIIKAINIKFMNVPMDGRFLRLAQERVNLACKVATADDGDRKQQRDQQWFIDQANQAGLEVDDDLFHDTVANNDEDRGVSSNSSSVLIKARQKEARIARLRLQQLLSQPIQTQRYGKFLSTIMIQQQTTARPATLPHVMPSSSTKTHSSVTSLTPRKKKQHK
jgi:hypothetical protein